jgi:hypothetical protein
MDIKLIILTTLFGVIAGFYHFPGRTERPDSDNA